MVDSDFSGAGNGVVIGATTMGGGSTAAAVGTGSDSSTGGAMIGTGGTADTVTDGVVIVPRTGR